MLISANVPASYVEYEKDVFWRGLTLTTAYNQNPDSQTLVYNISLSIVVVFLCAQKRIWRQVEARALRLLSRVFFVFLDSFILYCRNP